MYAKKSLGQHFIHDQNIHRKIVRIAGGLEGFNVIEIGSGYGGLSREILAAHPKSFVAIEKDEGFRDLYNDAELSDHVVFGDATKIDERSIVDQPVKLIANLPFNVSSMLLFKWRDYISFFTSITIMLQKELAHRLAADPCSKQYGRLSVMFQCVADVKVEFTLNPKCFVPAPKVWSTVVSVIPKEETLPMNDAILNELTRFFFNHRRKQIGHLMIQFLKSKGLYTPITLTTILDDLQLEQNARPEMISVEKYCQFSKILEKVLSKEANR